MHLLLERSLWRVSEADRHSVVGVHQADRDREIHEFPFLKRHTRGLVRLIRHAGLGNARHCFGPRKGGTLTLVKEVPGFGPGLYQRQLLDFLSVLQQVARVHIEAVGAVVDLRNAQIDQVNKRGGRLLCATYP
jgi:hypothetical protein